MTSSRPGDVAYAYEYDDRLRPTKATARVRRLKSGLHLAQIEGLPAGGFNYSFVASLTSMSFEVVEPAGENSERAAKYGLKVKPNGLMPGSGELIGSLDSAIAFLESFKRADLQTALTCRRQAS